MLASLLPAVLASVLALAPAQKAKETPAREPGPGAPAHEVFQSRSKAGLRYTWVVPEGYDGARARDLSVILHGSGLDYRWGHWNNPAGVFRPSDVVVSVDGTSPGEKESRLFLGEKDDAEAFADFLAEMRAAFAVRDVYLYGHSQGAFFVTYFAALEPKLVRGVVAHASGVWTWTELGKQLSAVPLAFMHGTLDPVVPYVQSVGARDACNDLKLPLVHLRRLDGYNHWPNAVRATESIDWCEGMSCAEPERALEAARRILKPKPSDEYKWETAVGFSAARQILRRFEPKAAGAFAAPGAQLEADALALAQQIEQHAALHVEALEQQVRSKKDLKLAPGAWLGHLLALREDFRGVDAVEAYAKRIEFDALAKAQEKAASKLRRNWYNASAEPKDKFEVALEVLPECFLLEGLPHDLASSLEAWKRDAKQHALDKKSLQAWPVFEAWKSGREDGRREYEALWRRWD